MSLKLALEQLGFGPCYHMTEILKNPFHARLWRAADAGHRVDWAELFVRYRATVDWPACHYYRELMQEFPEAKVILTTRDPDQWYDSMANTLYSLKKATEARQANPDLGPVQVPYVENRIWHETFSGRFEDRQYATMAFQRHNAEVIDCVPAERLLVYRVAEGWRPLCEFLGVAQPDSLFPLINTTQSFREYNRYQLGIS
jgi:Sulfotransferase domain